MPRPHLASKSSFLSLLTVLLIAACGGSDGADIDKGSDDGKGNDDGNGNNDGNGNDDGPSFGDGNDKPGSSGNSEGRDPVDCAEAASSHSYVGCDYWPTVTPNPVAASFHFVVAVANTGTKDANVTVTGPNSFNKTVTVPAGTLSKVELPWVSQLKGPDSNGEQQPVATVLPNGAYHLVSSSPVIVYQFNPYEYELNGKNSYTNDASLLLPSTAMTGNYRIAGMHAFKTTQLLFFTTAQPTVLTVTATAPNTKVKLRLSSTGAMVAAGPVAAGAAGSLVEFTLANAGDVAQLQTPGKNDNEDFSGSVLQADKAVQVITSVPCIYLPKDKAACDHIEETLAPAESFGKKYVLGTPTGFNGQAASQVVRLFGNQDGTKLTYSPKKPAGCPDTLSAGQVAECGVVGESFVVEGDKEFTALTFLLGASYYTASNPNQMGDPSQTSHPAVEQFRKNYIFLAPPSYPSLWADVTAPKGSTLTLDGNPVTATWEQIGDSGYGVFRLDLTKSGKDGVHSLTSTQPVGVQVLGYGSYTTFQYPAGLNLNLIAKPPGVN